MLSQIVVRGFTTMGRFAFIGPSKTRQKAMWVSQTYLTNLRVDGAVAAYFLFEAYRDDHAKVESFVRPKLAKLAYSLGDSAHVFVPAEDEKSSIEKEVNDRLRRRSFRDIELPGILVLDYAMSDVRSGGTARFISFKTLLEDPNGLDARLEEVKDAFIEVHKEMQRKDVGFSKALQNLQLKLTWLGMGYDFKPHIVNWVGRMQRKGPTK